MHGLLLRAVLFVALSRPPGVGAARLGVEWDSADAIPNSLNLSHNISDSYYARGPRSGVSRKMDQHRIGTHGRAHSFHLPQGPSMLQAHGVATKRHSSLSTLTRLEHGINPTKPLPEWRRGFFYRDPLASKRDKEGAVIREITESRYSYYLDEMTNPNSAGLRVSSRNWQNAAATAKVVSFLRREFESMGFTTCIQTFNSWRHPYNSMAAGQAVSNVIAYVQGTLPGTVTLGAHFDTMPDGKWGRMSKWLGSFSEAPGAVDNGSGTAAVLTMAKAWMEASKRIRLKPKRSMYFVAFGGEEEWLYGSDRFAQELARPGSSNSPIPEACRAFPTQDHKAIIMDMIGWKNPRFKKDTVTMETEDWASKELLSEIAQSNFVNNGNRLKLLYNNKAENSDHESFLKNGLKAVLTMDNDGDAYAYPCYHKSCDNISNVNIKLATEISRMNMGAMLRLSLLH